MFYLYILQSQNFGTYYIGTCKDIGIRLQLHNNGKIRSTKNKLPWLLIGQEVYSTLGQARRREKYLKSLKKRLAIEKEIKHF